MPGGVVGADLLGGGSGRSIAEAAAAGFLGGGIRAEEQMSVLAEAADGRGVVGEMLEHGTVGVASIEGEQEEAARPSWGRYRGRRATPRSVRGRAD